MKSKSMPYPVLVAILIVVCVAARCVGEYSQGQERDARIEQHVSSPIVHLIPDCGRRAVMFNVGNDGIVRYWCGK